VFLTQLTRLGKGSLQHHYNNVLYTQDGCLLL